MVSLVGFLIGWLAVRLVGSFVVSCLFVCLVCMFVGWWLVGLVGCWFIGWLVNLVGGWFIGELLVGLTMVSLMIVSYSSVGLAGS